MSVISNKNVQTRKGHTCFGCGRKMPKGTKMNAVTSTENGAISTDYWCDICQSYWDKYMNFGDEIGFAELRIEDKKGWEEIRKSLEDATA